MATKDDSIEDLCARVQKLVPGSVGGETWYLIVVSKDNSLPLLCVPLGLFSNSSPVLIIAIRNHRFPKQRFP